MVRRIRGVSASRRRAVLDFAPGEAAQVDFGKGSDHQRRVHRRVDQDWIFVMTLCFSRHMFAEIVTDQKVATWLACHRRAFASSTAWSPS
jgi:transposase